LTTSQPNTLPSEVSRPPEETAQIAAMLRQCFDLFNTYGRDPSALRSMLPVFEEVLAPYPTAKINSAFREWLRTEPAMPTPADILKILKWEPLPKSPETRMFERLVEQKDREIEKYHQLPFEKQAEHDKLMAELRDRMATDSGKKTRGSVDPDYTHWNMTPPEAQAEVKRRWISAWQRLKEDSAVNGQQGD